MSALEQKRQEYATNLQALKTEKALTIEKKVEAYRQTLIAEQSHEDEKKIENVIAALDQVIAYENSTKAI